MKNNNFNANNKVLVRLHYPLFSYPFFLVPLYPLPIYMCKKSNGKTLLIIIVFGENFFCSPSNVLYWFVFRI